MKKKQKCYYVWNGFKTGLFYNWPECEKATKGFPNVQFAGMDLKEGEIAASMTYEEWMRRKCGMDD